jgi:hypothetical protein
VHRTFVYCCAAKLPKLKPAGPHASLAEQLAAADCPALTALQQQLRSQLRPRPLPRLQQQVEGGSGSRATAARGVCELLQGLLIGYVATASSSNGSSRVAEPAGMRDVDSWCDGISSSSWGYDEAPVEVQWLSPFGGNSTSTRSTDSSIAAAAAEQRSAGCGSVGTGSRAAGNLTGEAAELDGVGQQLQSVAGAAGMCDAAGLGQGTDTAIGGLQAPAIAALQSCKPAVGLGLSAAVMCKAGPAAADSPRAQATCAGNADVQSCFAQEEPAVAARPDFVEWDVWYAGLASLVE